MAKLIQLALAALSFAELGKRVRGAAVSAAFAATGGFIGLAGAGFLIAALWLFIAERQGALAANLWIGAGLVLLGLIVLVAGRGKQPAASATSLPLGDMPDVQNYMNVITGELDKHLGKKGSGLQTTAIVAAVGFVLGRLLRR